MCSKAQYEIHAQVLLTVLNMLNKSVWPVDATDYHQITITKQLVTVSQFVISTNSYAENKQFYKLT